MERDRTKLYNVPCYSSAGPPSGVTESDRFRTPPSDPCQNPFLGSRTQRAPARLPGDPFERKLHPRPAPSLMQVSTDGQTTENQMGEIAQAGFDIPSYRQAIEVVSGGVPTMDRPEFTKLVEKMEPGDTLVVPKFYRSGRNAMNVEATIRTLAAIPAKVHCRHEQKPRS